MRNYLRFLIGPVLVAGVGYVLYAQEAEPARLSGKVLLLKNGYVMEGEIDRVGGEMRIRRGAGEARIAVDATIRLCADWDDAYAFVLTRVKANDPNDCMRVARWCQLHHLNDKAIEQAKRALELQPDHEEAKRLVTLLERTLSEPTRKVTPPIPKAVAERKSEPALTVDVASETSISFMTKVQPILMNTCATCHTTGNGGKFELERVSESGQRAAAQRNLAAVLAHVDLDRPAISPLLVKAFTPHGGAVIPPIKDRSAKPLQAMQAWVEQAIRRNPQLRDHFAAKNPSIAAPKESSETKSTFSTQRSSMPTDPEEVSRPVRRIEPKGSTSKVETPRAPTLPPQRDWCDADWFNDWAHPSAARQQAASNRP